MGLTYKERQFVANYLGESAGNATDAARRAGYCHPMQTSNRLLRKADIRAAIDATLDEAALKTDEILSRLSDIASIDMMDFVTIDEEGRHKIDLAKIKKRRRGHLIKKLTPTKYGLGIELHDAQAALEKLGRYRRLFGDTGNGDAPGESRPTTLPPDTAAAVLRTVRDREHNQRSGVAGEGDAPDRS